MTLLDAERRIDRTEAGISDLKEDFNMLQMDLLGKMNEVLRLIQLNNSDVKLCQAGRPCTKRTPGFDHSYHTMTRPVPKSKIAALVAAVSALAAAITAAISNLN